jgi:hypothetical protein
MYNHNLKRWKRTNSFKQEYNYIFKNIFFQPKSPTAVSARYMKLPYLADSFRNLAGPIGKLGAFLEMWLSLAKLVAPSLNWLPPLNKWLPLLLN